VTRRIDEAVLETVALSLWLGAAALFIASVAPAAFAVMPSRTLAGAIVGRVLPSVFYGGMAVGAAVVAFELLARRSLTRARTVSGGIMIAACVVAQFAVGSRIERLRVEIGGPLESLSVGDLRRAAFGRLHGASVALLGVAMLSAFVALVLAVRALQPRS
jgi:hypothetical protein